MGLNPSPSSRPGKKHRLIFYNHTIDRFWRFILIFDVVLWIAWWFAPSTYVFVPPKDQGLLTAAWICLWLFVLIFAIRNRAYIQAHVGFVKIKFPMYSLKIPYNVVHTMMSQELGMIHDRESMKFGEYRFFKPYFGKTMMALLLKSYPKSERSIKFFMPDYLFLPNDIGFLIYVKDWMGFSTEFDSRSTLDRTANMDRATVQDDSMYNLLGEN